jgi:hypothetical protein
MRPARSLVALALLGWSARAQSVLETYTPTQGLHTPIVSVGDRNSDGFADFLAGDPYWDSASGPDAGRMILVNGKRFASSLVPKTLGTYPLGLPGQNAGWSIAAIGDLTGDGWLDYAVGAPRIGDNSASSRVYLLSGVDFHTLGSLASSALGTEFGKSLAATGDVNGDGKGDVLVGAPLEDYGAVDAGRVYLISGAKLLASDPVGSVLKTFSTTLASSRSGESVASADFDHDGKKEFVFGAPGYDGPVTDRGLVYVYSGADFSFMWGCGGTGSEQLGTTLVVAPDLNADSTPELLAGAPYNDMEANAAGCVWVFNGSSIPNAIPAVIDRYATWYPNAHMGKSLAVVGDVNHDFVPDIAAGSPDVDGLFTLDLGGLWVFSGKTGARIGQMIGSASQRRVGEFLCAGQDYDGDGITDFLVGGEWSIPGFSSVSLFPATPTTYCTGKTNSQGCVPYIYSNGTASLSSGAAFFVRGANFLNNRAGLLFYGYGPAATPFQGGKLCIAAPVKRTPGQVSGGTPPPTIDCTGTYSLDANALIQSTVGLQQIGLEVFCQYYARDPSAVAGSSLSNAANFVIGP